MSQVLGNSLSLDIIRQAKRLLESSAEPLLSGQLGRYEGLKVVFDDIYHNRPTTPQERSRYDIETVRAAIKRMPRRRRRALERKLARMEEKFALRSLLGWDWLAEHPEHPLHIPAGEWTWQEPRARQFFGQKYLNLAANPAIVVSSQP